MQITNGSPWKLVLVSNMIFGANIAFVETIDSCPKREQMLCKKRDITSLSDELKQEMVDIKETMNELKKEIQGLKNSMQVPQFHRDCSENTSFTGVRTIQPQGQNAFRVYCSGGCVYMARRFDGSVDFYRGWTEY
ncbi:unnamed protein product, partial [Owenia fusiformis]